MPDMVAVVGLLVGFLVVGVIGIYVGDQMIQAANMNFSTGDSALLETQKEVTKTFDIAVSMSKIVVIVAVFGVIFALLRTTLPFPSGSWNRDQGIPVRSAQSTQTRTGSGSELVVPQQEVVPQPTQVPVGEVEITSRAGALEFSHDEIDQSATSPEKPKSRASALEFKNLKTSQERGGL